MDRRTTDSLTDSTLNLYLHQPTRIFFEKESEDKTAYKGFTYKDDRFQVGGEMKVKSIAADDDDAPEVVVPFKKKKFGGNIRKKTRKTAAVYRC